MSQQATLYHLKVSLSDVDRGVYEALDLRLARHPSETARYMLTRALAYCCCFEEGIAFSKGLSSTDEPALWIKDLQGSTTTWIEVGAPSADRLHKAKKATARVVVFTSSDLTLLRKEWATKAIHQADRIEVYTVTPGFLDALDDATDRNSSWDLTRSDGQIYVTTKGGAVIEGTLVTASVTAPSAP